jgi:hypothetical protein
LPFPTIPALASRSIAKRWRGYGHLLPSARMHEERDQKDDRQRNADKPQQSAFYEFHANLLSMLKTA